MPRYLLLNGVEVQIDVRRAIGEQNGSTSVSWCRESTRRQSLILMLLPSQQSKSANDDYAPYLTKIPATPKTRSSARDRFESHLQASQCERSRSAMLCNQRRAWSGESEDCRLRFSVVPHRYQWPSPPRSNAGTLRHGFRTVV